jgi:hypothetical protein
VCEQGKGASWKIVHGWMALWNEKACYEEIEKYVDGYDQGLTRKQMRFAAGLPPAAPTPATGAQPPPDPIQAAMQGMQANSDALICWCLDNDIEYMTEALCRLAPSCLGSNHTKRRAYFLELVSRGFWKASVVPQGNASQCYVPMVKTAHTIASVFPQDSASREVSLPEEIGVHNLKDSFYAHPVRLHNVEVLLKHFEARKAALLPKPGRASQDNKIVLSEVEGHIIKIRTREERL